MTAIDKLIKAASLEELNAITKEANARKRELKSVGNPENQAILRGLVVKAGSWDAFKVDLAVVRKEFKEAAKEKAEADLEGLAEDEREAA